MKNTKTLTLISISIFIFFANIIFTDKIYFFRDLLNVFMPYRLFAAENIHNGIIPIWNPYSFFGQPFLANPETSLFYPFTILFYIFKFATAYKLFILLHFFLAAVAFYIAARLLKAKNSFAIIASIAWTFGGYLTARIEFLSILGSAIWLPIILIFLIKNKKILLGLTFAIQIFAGHPQVFFYSVILLLFFLNKQRAITLVCSLVFALCISAIQLLPFGEFVKNSNRSEGLTYEEASSVSIKPAEIIKNVLPQKTIDIRGNYWLKSFYIGIIPLIFVFIYFFTGDKKLLLPLAIIIILALGRNTPIYQFLYQFCLPFSKIRYPAAITFLLAFILCLMVSQVKFPSISQTDGQEPNPACGTRTRERLLICNNIAYFIPLLVLLTLVDLYVHAQKLNPTMSSKLLNLKTENMFILQKKLGNQKYLVLPDAYSNIKTYYEFVNTLPTNVNIPYHLHNAAGYDPITTKGIEDFVETLKKQPDMKELAKYGIKYIISAKCPDPSCQKITGNLYENTYSDKVANKVATKTLSNPQKFHPKTFYFISGLWITIFSAWILLSKIFFL